MPQSGVRFWPIPVFFLFHLLLKDVKIPLTRLYRLICDSVFQTQIGNILGLQSALVGLS